MHRSPSPRDTVVGYLYVAVQMVLLGMLVLWRPGPDWSQPDWLTTSATVANFGCGALLVLALLNLGRSISAVPLPVEHGALVTTGLYSRCRHPVYAALIGVALTSAVSWRAWETLGVAVALATVLTVKSRFEERHLLTVYPDYAGYRARVPRFVPVGRRHP